MSITTTVQPARVLRGRRAIPWLTVAPLAIVLAYADGFWLTSLQGAIGAIERAQAPFATWLRSSTFTVPVFLLAVMGALALARRWFGPSLSGAKAVVATALLVAAAAGLVGIGDIVVSAAYDYHLQSNLIQASQLTHTGSGAMAGMSSTDPGMAGMAMGSVASQQRATLVLHVRGVGYAAGALLVTNLLLVAWVVALRGGSWGARRPSDAAAATPAA